MTKYLLDSNAVANGIFQRRGVDQRTMQARRNGHVIGTALPVVAEILGGRMIDVPASSTSLDRSPARVRISAS